MQEGQATISPDILARYAGDAAREVDGVQSVTGRRGVKVTEADGVTHVEVHVCLAWGASIPEVGTAVRERVGRYLAQMAKAATTEVEVIVDEITTP
jgi:uncharacterized alkaline shock family protein YloU